MAELDFAATLQALTTNPSYRHPVDHSRSTLLLTTSAWPSNLVKFERKLVVYAASIAHPASAERVPHG